MPDAVLRPKAEREPILVANGDAGLSFTVKNTFIVGPADAVSDLQDASCTIEQPLKTAPAKVNFGERCLASVQTTAFGADHAAAPGAAADKPSSAAVQRPSLQDTAVAADLGTPSPTSSSMFSSARHQLFGGPAPVQNATHSALGPAAWALPSGTVAGAVTVPDLKAQQLPSDQQEPGSKASHSDDEEEDDDEDSGDGDTQRQPLLNANGEPPRLPPPGAEHPSIGSASHEGGTCKRCCFFPRNRCVNGYDCEFCHYQHEKRRRKSRKAKKKKASASVAPGAAADAIAAAAAEVTAGGMTDAKQPQLPKATNVAMATLSKAAPKPCGGRHVGDTSDPPVWHEGSNVATATVVPGNVGTLDDGHWALQPMTFQWVDAPPSYAHPSPPCCSAGGYNPQYGMPPQPMAPQPYAQPALPPGPGVAPGGLPPAAGSMCCGAPVFAAGFGPSLGWYPSPAGALPVPEHPTPPPPRGAPTLPPSMQGGPLVSAPLCPAMHVLGAPT